MTPQAQLLLQPQCQNRVLHTGNRTQKNRQMRGWVDEKEGWRRMDAWVDG